MRPIKRAIHLDFHTCPGIWNFNESWDARKFAETLKEAGVEYINAFARCNMGFSYYPTKVGVPYPGMKGDMFGDLLRECHRLDIGVTAYFNGELNHVHSVEHREWLLENANGQILYGDRSANFFREMCFNGGYRKHLLAEVREVLTLYPDVDGIFIDCMIADKACYCPDCRRLALKKGMDPESASDMLKLRLETELEVCREIKEMVGPGKYLKINSMQQWLARDLNTHGELECLPGSWSYDYFPANVAYVRNIYDHTVYMTGRFQKNWGDLGGLRTKASLENDIWDAHMNAVGVMIGDHMHPARNLEPDVYRLVKEVYDDVKKLEPYTERARCKADIGVLTNPNEKMHATQQGAARMLGELHYGFDILNETMDLSGYALLILPDNIRVTPLLAEKLRAHLQAGKGIIASGESGLNEDCTAFVMEEWGMQADGKNPTENGYLRMCGKSEDEVLAQIPAMDCSLYSGGILFRAGEGDSVYAKYVKPYFSRSWDGFHGLFYTPSEGETGHAALARHGNIFHFCFPVFAAYADSALQAHKLLVEYCIRQLLPKPSFYAEGLPSAGRLSVTEKEGMTMVHVKISAPEPRGNMNIIEEHAYLPAGLRVYVKGSFSEAYLAKDHTPVPLEKADGYTAVTLPEIRGYELAVLQ